MVNIPIESALYFLFDGSSKVCSISYHLHHAGRQNIHGIDLDIYKGLRSKVPIESAHSISKLIATVQFALFDTIYEILSVEMCMTIFIMDQGKILI